MSGKVQQPPPPRPAFCEDYNDETNTTLPGTRRSANVAAKRSKPQLAKVRPTIEPADGASDSGYSSRTAATVGSGDSNGSGKRSPPDLRVDTSKHDRTSRPTVTERRNDGSRRNPSHSDPQRSPSRSRRRESLRQDQVMPERSRPVIAPFETPWRVDFPPFPYTAQPMYDGPQVPPSPQSARYPPPQMWTQEIITPQNTNARPRLHATPSYQRNARPMSIHGGVMQQEMMFIPMPPPQAYDHGPPPSASAYMNIPYSYAPPPTAYVPAPVPPHRGLPDAQPPPSPYYETRPKNRIEQPASHRRSSVYGTPVVDYDYPQPVQAPQRERRFSMSRESRPRQASRSMERDEDYYRMPPPPTKPQVVELKKRPSLRKPTATNPALSVRRQSRDYSDTRLEMIDRPRREDHEPASPRRRPSLDVNPGGRKSVSYTGGANTVKVASSAAMSRSKTFHGRNDLEDIEREIESYQDSKSGKKVPLTADTLKHVRRSHKGGSDSESQSLTSSSRSTSDIKPKSGTISRSEPENVTMTVHGVKFNVPKDMKISFRGTGLDDENLDIQIGDKHVRDDLPRRKEIEDGRRTRDQSRGADHSSRRTSRSGASDLGSVK